MHSTIQTCSWLSPIFTRWNGAIQTGRKIRQKASSWLVFLSLFYITWTVNKMWWWKHCTKIKSPKEKYKTGAVSFLSPVVRLRPPVCPSVRPFVNFSYFLLLVKNHRAKFNHSYYKAFLWEGDCKDKGQNSF